MKEEAPGKEGEKGGGGRNGEGRERGGGKGIVNVRHSGYGEVEQEMWKERVG